MNDSISGPGEVTPRTIPRSEHSVSRANISSNALKVLYRLKSGGYSAYVVGGGVRDLLLGLHPKDFDVVTDAHPEDVRRLFKNCRLIGRRFRLAHVRFGRDIIEVATFRAATGGEDEEDREHSESGRILRDNVYGSIHEDIWRRDFTVNALYYNIADFTIVDYTSGMDDIRDRVLRLIGEPETRYREDPVRMLRAVRLAAKLGFEIAPEAAQPIAELAPLLADVPPARLFDEVLKLFQAGYAARSFELLAKFGLLRYVFPTASAAIEGPGGNAALELIRAGLANTDQRVEAGLPVTPTFLFAIFLWPGVRERAEQLEAEGLDAHRALTASLTEALAEQQRHTSFPRRYATPMREMLLLQRRFTNRRGARAARLLEHKLFRAAYDFMLLRVQQGELGEDVAEWWTQAQTLPAAERREAFSARPKRRRGGRRRRGRSLESAPDAPS